jgi:aspartate/methionine/tyrosine aminotransferase
VAGQTQRLRLARRGSRLGTESAFEVLRRAQALEAQGRTVIHLEIGEPDFATPPHIVEAGIAALRDGYTHYTPTTGILPLREAIARYVSRTRGIAAGPQEVVVTPGAKPILFFTLLALVEDGDEVIYPDPGFPIYRSMISYVDGVPVPLPLREERGFSFDVADLRRLITPRTRLLILNSPQNPTSGVLSADDLRGIGELCLEHDLLVLSDEIYSRMLYDGLTYQSIASLPGMAERTIIMDGFSKAYAMTGWRLGYGVMPAELAAHMGLLMVNSNSCTAAFTQLAGVAALEGPDEPVQAMVAEFDRRRRAIVDGLNTLPGMTCVLPHGAFYAFPNITGTGLTSVELADYLLQEAGVATLAGSTFGAAGEGYLRLSYANSLENIGEALERMRAALERRL